MGPVWPSWRAAAGKIPGRSGADLTGTGCSWALASCGDPGGDPGGRETAAAVLGPSWAPWRDPAGRIFQRSGADLTGTGGAVCVRGLRARPARLWLFQLRRPKIFLRGYFGAGCRRGCRVGGEGALPLPLHTAAGRLKPRAEFFFDGFYSRVAWCAAGILEDPGGREAAAAALGPSWAPWRAAAGRIFRISGADLTGTGGGCGRVRPVYSRGLILARGRGAIRIGPSKGFEKCVIGRTPHNAEVFRVCDRVPVSVVRLKTWDGARGADGGAVMFTACAAWYNALFNFEIMPL